MASPEKEGEEEEEAVALLLGSAKGTHVDQSTELRGDANGQSRREERGEESKEERRDQLTIDAAISPASNMQMYPQHVKLDSSGDPE